jgi:hypothetical protein
LTVKLHPQVEGLVYKDGSELRLPHGAGTLVQVQATWVDEIDALRERAAHLVAHALGYGVASADVVDDSLGFHKLELHHRLVESKEGDVVQTIRQSADLLAAHAADVETEGEHEDSRWLTCKLSTDAWEQLGFRQFDAAALLKLYYPDNPDRVDYPLNQPKLEVALQGTGGGALRASLWDRMRVALEEILLSHLRWAGVSAADIVADEYSDGAAADPCDWAHPEGRRDWLRDHYQSLVPDLYREATRPQTRLVYDILEVVRRDGPVTYQQLMDATGGAYRTIRAHVRRLCEEVGGDGPGILEKVQDVETWVALSSRFFADEAGDALDEVLPDDTPADRDERAQQRRERRQQRRAARASDEDSHDQDTGDGAETDEEPSAADEDDREAPSDEPAPAGPVWRSLRELDVDAQQLAAAIDRAYVPPDHVRVRVDVSPLFDYSPG